MPEEIDLGIVDFVTINTIGPPGDRTFHVQAGSNDNLLTLTLEKEQAAAITTSINNVLDEIEKQHKLVTPDPTLAKWDMDLREPIQPRFRVAQIGLAYNEEDDLLVLVMSELQANDSLEEPNIVRISASREQMQVLAVHTRIVVASGRATPQSNGHLRKTYE